MALHAIDQLLADGLIAGGSDADRDFADVVSILGNVDGHGGAVGGLRRDLTIDFGAIALDVSEFEILAGLLHAVVTASGAASR